MSKRILARVACVGLIWGVVYNISDRLMADRPTPTANQPTGTYYGEEGGYPDPTKPYLEPAGSYQAPHSSPVGPWGASTATPTDSTWSPDVAGTFSVVSDGKRSIMVNTTTGDSWLLVVDNPGIPHWEKIGKDATGEQTGSNPLSLSERHKAAQVVRDKDLEASELRGERKALRQMLDMRMTQNNQLRDEVTELKKQLHDTRDALNARPQPAPPQPVGEGGPAENREPLKLDE